MSVRENTLDARYYFLDLDNSGGIDRQINTLKGDILTLRVKRVPTGSSFFLMDDPTNDSLICDLEIHGR